MAAAAEENGWASAGMAEKPAWRAAIRSASGGNRWISPASATSRAIEPRELADATDTLFSYTVGQIGYWPPSHDMAFFTVDDGKLEIPASGILHLGTITTGLETIATAGDSFTLTIEKA